MSLGSSVQKKERIVVIIVVFVRRTIGIRNEEEHTKEDDRVKTHDVSFKQLRTHPKSSPAVPEHIGRRVVAVVRKHDHKQDVKDVK
jgi:hypothetical protein